MQSLGAAITVSWVTLAALFATPAAAQSQQERDPTKLFLVPRRPPAGQTCWVETKGNYASFSAAFDSAGALAQLAAYPPGAVVVAVHVPGQGEGSSSDRRRAIDTLVLLESTLPDSLAGSALNVLRSALRTDTSGFLLVRIDLGGTTRVRTARTLGCAPVQTNGAALGQHLLELLGTGPPAQVVVDLVVLKDGMPTEATILHSSGNAQFDARALEIVPLMRFLPGRLNRVPVAVRVQVPIHRQ